MKKLIAIAIVAAVTTPAMADTTIYGQLHASVDYLTGVGSEVTVSSNSSRIGVKGSAPLNGGLKAIYKAEWGMDTGHTSSGLTDRNQVVGLAGNFGAVLVGRHDTPMKIIGRKADLFWSTQLGQNRNIVNPGQWDRRPNNVIAYQSPKMGGFQMLGAYVTEDQNSAEAFSINGIYKAGPLMVGAAYETHTQELTGGVTDASAVRLMASYKMGRSKLVGFYQGEDGSGGVAGADADTLGLGLAYKVSANGTVKGQYYIRDSVVNVDSQLFALGYDHKLGKKTDIYAQYALTKDAGGIGGTGHGERVDPDTDADASGFSVGMRHKF